MNGILTKVINDNRQESQVMKISRILLEESLIDMHKYIEDNYTIKFDFVKHKNRTLVVPKLIKNKKANRLTK